MSGIQGFADDPAVNDGILPVGGMIAEGLTILNFAGNGSTPPARTTNGIYSLTAWGTWGGATAFLQMSPDKGKTWITINSSGINQNSCLLDFRLSAFDNVRWLVSGGTNSVLNFEIVGD
jgi:hypothetical protein